MATLVREKDEQDERDSTLDAVIPAPFPVDAYRKEQEHHALLHPENTELADPFADQVEEYSLTIEDESTEQDGTKASQESVSVSNELVPSLVYVQQTCLMTLNNLLSGAIPSSSTWQPILPPRRHSMPSRPEVRANTEPSSAIQTLVSNLRNSGYGEMIEASSSNVEDSALITELHRRVESISQDLLASDARLARALISLLAHVDRLSHIDPGLSTARLDGSVSLDATSHHFSVDLFGELSRHVLDLQAKRQGYEIGQPMQSLSSHIQVEMSLLWTKIDQELDTVSQICRQRNDPVPRPYSPGQLPPDYDYDDVDDDTSTLPPEYDYAHQSYVEKEKSGQYHPQTASDVHGEKMRMDFESVTMAIDRLYLVAPQLHNQRVELRKSKVEELERARLAGPLSLHKAEAFTKEKEKQKDVKELEKIIAMVDKASNRRLNDQSVIINGDMQARLERAKEMDKEKRNAFVEHLAAHSDSRRIVSQDAVLDISGIRNPNTLLTLPEFIREAPTEDEIRELDQDPNALLTFSEIVKELPPSPRPLEPTHSFENLKVAKKHFKALSKRSRSISAPPLAWLIPSLTRSPSSSGSSSPAPPNEQPRGKARDLLVRYVAEYHEHLSHVLVFVGVDEGFIPGFDLEACVTSCAHDPQLGDMLILKCGPNVSAPLSLPVSVPSGTVNVQVQGNHYEIKIAVPSPAVQQENLPDADSSQFNRLLDSEQITEMKPSSFICASCSSTLIQSRSFTLDTALIYNDLPSEYWTELLEAWMCHKDQKLNDRVARYSQGLWPKPGQALVGGSYFLFDESAIIFSNLKIMEMTSVSISIFSSIGRIRRPTLVFSPMDAALTSSFFRCLVRHHQAKLSADTKRPKCTGPSFGGAESSGKQLLGFEDIAQELHLMTHVLLSEKFYILTDGLPYLKHGDGWKRALCICGAIVGRCRTHYSNDTGESVVYRIPKYAIRPVSLTAEPSRIPFSAFVLEDMLEIVKAHATYRFIILDEEEERPRLLIWLFKPYMRLSYATTAQYTLPKTGSVNTSKILFKILRNIPDGPSFASSSTHTPATPFDLDKVLEKYPGFPQAERLLYPRDICHRLANLLKESNTAYPFGVRVMTGLLTGWLRRE